MQFGLKSEPSFLRLGQTSVLSLIVAPQAFEPSSFYFLNLGVCLIELSCHDDDQVTGLKTWKDSKSMVLCLCIHMHEHHMQVPSSRVYTISYVPWRHGKACPRLGGCKLLSPISIENQALGLVHKLKHEPCVPSFEAWLGSAQVMLLCADNTMYK